MKTSDFSFELPPGQIAQEPPERRGESRLFILERSGGNSHHTFAELPDLLSPGTLMVFNDSRVRRARLYASVGGQGPEREFLLTRRLGGGRWEFMAKRQGSLKPGSTILFPEGRRAHIEAGGRCLVFDEDPDEEYFERCGHVPLPPYIKRPDRAMDGERYQTCYAREAGSAAAPTAGLHFTPQIMEALKGRGIQAAYLTLHVGLGTFMPVRTAEIEEHRMHEEEYYVPPETAQAVTEAKAAGRPVLAVGTTSLRTLEAAWDDEGESLRPGPGRTRIFIKPGYVFRAIDQLLTNFHTPESTLLMLVCALAGRQRILDAYAEAVRLGYRFFSYGDAMLIR
jgi:S-adenosylmethionine:tRNA ribosyltransferase-isomerase